MKKKPMTSGHYHKQQFSCKAGSSHSIPFSIPLFKAAEHEVLVNTVAKLQLPEKAAVQDRQAARISNELMGGQHTGIM